MTKLLTYFLAILCTGVLMPPSLAATTAGEIKTSITGKEFLVQMMTDQSMKKCTYDSGTAKFSCVDIVSAGPNFLYQGAVDIGGNGLSDAIFFNISQGDKGDVTFWPDFVKSQAVTPRQARTLWRAENVGDLDGDGIGDIAWRFTGQTPNLDDTGVSYIWFMNRDGTVNQVRKRGGAPLTWKAVGSADINGDGAADTVYVSPTNAIRVLMATANRTCANFSAGTIDSRFTALAVASFSFTSTADVLARSAATGVVRLMTLNASGITLPAYTGAPDDPNASCTSTTQVIPQVLVRDIPSDPTWQFYATGDFNNDGLIDIVWKKPDGNLAVWFMSPGDGTPIVNNNAGSAPLGYMGLSQSGTRTNSADSVTYAIWGRGGTPFLVTKSGVTAVVNKSQYQVGVFPLFNCTLPQALANDGKLYVKCQDAVSLVRRDFYIDIAKNELYDFFGTIPPEIIFAIVDSNSNKPEWSAKARVADGWYYTTYNVTWVLKLQTDSGMVTTVKEGTFAGDGTVRILVSYTR